MCHRITPENTSQGFDKGPRQARVSHPPIKNTEHWEKAYAVEALVPETHVIVMHIFVEK